MFAVISVELENKVDNELSKKEKTAVSGDRLEGGEKGDKYTHT